MLYSILRGSILVSKTLRFEDHLRCSKTPSSVCWILHSSQWYNTGFYQNYFWKKYFQIIIIVSNGNKIWLNCEVLNSATFSVLDAWKNCRPDWSDQLNSLQANFLTGVSKLKAIEVLLISQVHQINSVTDKHFTILKDFVGRFYLFKISDDLGKICGLTCYIKFSVTTIRCWWRCWPFWPFIKCHQHRESVTNIQKSSTSWSHQHHGDTNFTVTGLQATKRISLEGLFSNWTNVWWFRGQTRSLWGLLRDKMKCSKNETQVQHSSWIGF